jgi:hypothetical protein
VGKTPVRRRGGDEPPHRRLPFWAVNLPMVTNLTVRAYCRCGVDGRVGFGAVLEEVSATAAWAMNC